MLTDDPQKNTPTEAGAVSEEWSSAIVASRCDAGHERVMSLTPCRVACRALLSSPQAMT